MDDHLARLNESGEIVQGYPRADLVVDDGHAARYPFVHDQDVGAAFGIDKGGSHRHLAAEVGICRLELKHFDYLFVRYKPCESAVVGVGMGCGLAGPSRGIVCE